MPSSKPVANSNALSKWWYVAGAVALVACAVELVLWHRLPAAPPKITGTTRITNDGFPKDNLVGSYDGGQLYFDELQADRSIVARVSTAGGGVVPVSLTIPDPRLLDVSPQSELLISSGASEADDVTFWTLSPGSGAVQRLGAFVGNEAVWEPNGKLLYVTGKDLNIADHDGSNSQKLVTAQGPPFAVRFSPDGSRMRFTIGNPKNRSTMWELRSDGSGMHPILPLPGWTAPPAPCCGRWISDGKYFVFTDAGRIWMVADTPGKYSEPVELNSNSLAIHDPVPSRDGKRLFAIGTQPRAELVSYDAHSKQFVPFLGGISAGDLDFSPDGQWVAYVSYPDGSLWRSKVDGSERLRLTSPPMQPILPRWSPDGARIVFTAGKAGEPLKIWIISKDGGDPQSQTPDNIAEADPNWSPDGSTLSFVRFTQPSKITLLDLHSRSRSELPDSAGLWRPRWSPDGRSVAAVSADSSALMIYDRTSKKWRQLAGDLGKIGEPSWSHDSRYIYFDVTLPHDSHYLRVGLAGGRPEQVASLKNVRRFLGVWGFWSGLAPGDIPLLVRDAGPQDVYAFDLKIP